LRLTLAKAEKKIPAALLRSECRMAELAHLSASGNQFLYRNDRIEIRKAITDRLLPTMPATLSGIPILINRNILYAGAISEKQMDVLTLNFMETTGVRLIPMTAQSISLLRNNESTEDIAPSSFSPYVEDALTSSSIGQDFLTWLLFYSETSGGIFKFDGSEYAFMLEAPLTFFMEGNGSHLVILRNGCPLVSGEAKEALRVGKKLTCARITMAQGSNTWTLAFSSEFVFRGLKIVKNKEDLDPVSQFQERMLALDTFMNAFLFLYDIFLAERLHPIWPEVRLAIHNWVDTRVTKG